MRRSQLLTPVLRYRTRVQDYYSRWLVIKPTRGHIRPSHVQEPECCINFNRTGYYSQRDAPASAPRHGSRSAVQAGDAFACSRVACVLCTRVLTCRTPTSSRDVTGFKRSQESFETMIGSILYSGKKGAPFLYFGFWEQGSAVFFFSFLDKKEPRFYILEKRERRFCILEKRERRFCFCTKIKKSWNRTALVIKLYI